MTPFRVAVCLLEDKKPIISAMFNPAKSDLYFAEKDRGTTLNNMPIKVSNNSELKNSVVMFHLSSKTEQRVKTLNILNKVFEQSMHIRMYGSSLAQMSYVAQGKFDAYFNIQSKQWDILPGALLVLEAGGNVTDIHGKEINYESTSVLATNGKVHEQMLKLLEGK